MKTWKETAWFLAVCALMVVYVTLPLWVTPIR